MLAPPGGINQYCSTDVIFTVTSEERAAAATTDSAQAAKCLAINN